MYTMTPKNLHSWQHTLTSQSDDGHHSHIQHCYEAAHAMGLPKAGLRVGIGTGVSLHKQESQRISSFHNALSHFGTHMHTSIQRPFYR